MLRRGKGGVGVFFSQVWSRLPPRIGAVYRSLPQSTVYPAVYRLPQSTAVYRSLPWTWRVDSRHFSPQGGWLNAGSIVARALRPLGCWGATG